MSWRALLVAVALGVIAFAIWYAMRGDEGRARLRGGDDAGTVAADAYGGVGDPAGGVRGSEVSDARDRVRGRIVDEDGQPVAAGSIVLSCLGGERPGLSIPGGVVRVGEDGEFEGPGCKGQVCAELRHPAMIQDEPWMLRPGRPVELRARMLDRLEGTVLDPDGDPVPAARLVMVPPPDDEDPTALPPFVSRNASTDADGHFSFAKLERPPCDACGEASGRCDPEQARDLPTYTRMLLTARADGYRMVETLVDAEQIEPVELRLMAPAAPLTGQLRDPEGRPYPRARVLARSNLRAYEQHAVAPEGTAFSFGELGDGGYDLRALQDGVELATASSAAAGDVVSLAGTVSAVGPELVVTVLGTEGRPLVGAAVAGGPFANARTDGSGQVRAADVMPGPYTLRVRAVGVRAFSRELTVPDTEGVYPVSLRAGEG